MIWDVDSYIVYEVGDLRISESPTFEFVSDPGYRIAARERYRVAYAKQTEKLLRYRQKRNGTES